MPGAARAPDHGSSFQEDRAFQNTGSHGRGRPYHRATPRAPWLALLGFLGLAGLAIGSGLAIGRGGTAWFATIERPAGVPSLAAIALLWACAHVESGLAGWLAWRAVGAARPTRLWGWQLAIAALLPPALFGLRSLAAAVVVASLLVGARAWTTRAFWPASRAAAALMSLALAASVYDGYLAIGFWMVNGGWARLTP